MTTSVPFSNGTPWQIKLPNVGEQILFEGRVYTIGSKIGEGGFGDVFECTDDFNQELVAKVIRPCGRSYDEAFKAWEREFKSLQALKHPNITHIQAAFEYERTFYLIIERCTMTLAELINQEWFTPDTWFQPLAREVCNALDFIHQQNSVHRDVHLGNVYAQFKKDVIFPERGAICFKVGDFGISKVFSTELSVRSLLAEWIRPPEAINPKEFGEAGVSCDIYHAGILFLSILTKKNLRFDKDQTIDGVPRKMAEALDNPFSPAIAKALRRHVSMRTQTVCELWRDIRFCGSNFAKSLPPAPRGN
jgi:serine/threonine protein kinase